MVHYLYVGNFDLAGDCIRMEKQPDGRPWPVVSQPLDMAIVRQLLEERGLSETEIPEDWWLGIEEEEFIVCNAYPPNRESIDFVRELARNMGCDVFYDGMVRFSPEELVTKSDEAETASI